jgi:hypothetical protein
MGQQRLSQRIHAAGKAGQLGDGGVRAVHQPAVRPLLGVVSVAGPADQPQVLGGDPGPQVCWSPLFRRPGRSAAGKTESRPYPDPLTLTPRGRKGKPPAHPNAAHQQRRTRPRRPHAERRSTREVVVRTPELQEALLSCAGSRAITRSGSLCDQTQPCDRYADGVSGVLLSAQQGQGSAEALFQEVVGELSVGQGVGEL